MSEVGNLSEKKMLAEFGQPIMDYLGRWRSAAQRKADAVTNLGFTQTAAAISNAAAGTRGIVKIPDATTYTVLAADSGKRHIIPDLTASITVTLPAPAAGLEYWFQYAGAATDAQNWVITGTPTVIKGGVLWTDLDAGPAADEILVVYSNGSSHVQITVPTVAIGTCLEFASDGTNWFLNGTAVSVSTPVFA